MKKSLILGLVISLVLVNCTQKPVKFPMGAWSLIQTQRVTNGKTVVTFPTAANKGKTTQVKMYSEKNWMFVGKSYRDTIVVDVYGGGTYTLEGIQYEENILYHYNKQWVGRISKNMTMELVNDTLTQSYHPISPIDGQPVDSVKNIQKYIRLK